MDELNWRDWRNWAITAVCFAVLIYLSQLPVGIYAP
jgi:hypothetical protein